jgi:hypothetical protein
VVRNVSALRNARAGLLVADGRTILGGHDTLIEHNLVEHNLARGSSTRSARTPSSDTTRSTATAPG